MNRDIMNIDEVAEYLQLNKKSIYRLIKSGELPAKKVLNKWRFSRERVNEWIGGKSKKNKIESKCLII